jgi:hypothetical protein
MRMPESVLMYGQNGVDNGQPWTLDGQERTCFFVHKGPFSVHLMSIRVHRPALRYYDLTKQGGIRHVQFLA